jgi:NTP pyrophosphatase (non-canonical NTP hydrolase)
MSLRQFQQAIAATFLEKDRRRGTEGTFVWFVEEVGELARALKKRDPASLREEFADVLAWLLSLANLSGVDLEEAMGKYAPGCPRCRTTPCRCP